MISTNDLAEIGALVGEPARAAMLSALLDGRALTARELADVAGITPQTASGHLQRLATARLLAVEKQGRHRYHRLATPAVAQMLEGMTQVLAAVGTERRRVVTGPRDAAMRQARVCYDHFAGRLGVAITDSLLTRGVIEFGDGSGLVTEPGMAVLDDLGIAVPGGIAERKKAARPLCRPCLDWSERRPHVAGALGAAICTTFEARRWVRRVAGSRALRITPTGQQALRDMFGVNELG